MITTYWLRITLQSDAAFTRGDGLAGSVNAEVQHDENGLPYLAGKTLKGLMTAACAEILFGMEQSTDVSRDTLKRYQGSAQNLFGKAGSDRGSIGLLHFGDACLPEALRLSVARDIQDRHYRPLDALESLTTLRRQTAMDPVTGAPLKNSLRTIRVILRSIQLDARLSTLGNLEPRDLALLAACAKALRRAGAHRGRGLGKITVDLTDHEKETVLQTNYETFAREVLA